MRRVLVSAAAIALAASGLLLAQATRPPSPAGTASTQIGGTKGKWIDITYSRPIKRGRDVYGSGASYGKVLLQDGAKVWRAGANQSTRLKTEVPLVIGGKTVPAGEYSLFIDVSPTKWTLIVSNWPAQQKYDPNNKDALWGSFGYTPDKDVVRAPMTLTTLPFSMEEMSWQLTDVSDAGGKLTMTWDKTAASVPFKVGQ